LKLQKKVYRVRFLVSTGTKIEKSPDRLETKKNTKDENQKEKRKIASRSKISTPKILKYLVIQYSKKATCLRNSNIVNKHLGGNLCFNLQQQPHRISALCFSQVLKLLL